MGNSGLGALGKIFPLISGKESHVVAPLSGCAPRRENLLEVLRLMIIEFAAMISRARARRKQVGSCWCTRTRRAALQSVPAPDQQAPPNENRCDYPTDLTDSRSRRKGAARCTSATASAAPLYSRRTAAMGVAEKHAASVSRARLPT